MAVVKLKAGETVVVAAVSSDLKPDQGLPTPQPPTGPVDPGYGVDLGLGHLKPSHPIVLPPPGEPTHPIVIPPTGPVDPAWGIDEDIGFVRPEHPIVLPPDTPGKPERTWEIKTAWTPVSGWVVVAVPTGEHPAPSKRK